MTSRKTVLLSTLAAAVLSVPLGGAASAAPSDAVVTVEPSLVEPVVIGHRGASGYRPEHTMAAYRLAIAQGADYIEPDLVSTSDGVLVARHENEIGGTTDVADHPEFADRRTTKVIDGREVTGWFTEDFTWKELRTLRAEERLPAVRPDNTAYDGQERIPTFDEVLKLAAAAPASASTPRPSTPPTSTPGLSLEEPLVAALRKRHWDDADDPVIIQSFETANLRELDTMVDVPLAQLVDGSGSPYDLLAAGDPRTYADLVTPAGLAAIATYADGIGSAQGPGAAAHRRRHHRPERGRRRRPRRRAAGPRVDAAAREPVHGHELPGRHRPERSRVTSRPRPVPSSTRASTGSSATTLTWWSPCSKAADANPAHRRAHVMRRGPWTFTNSDHGSSSLDNRSADKCVSRSAGPGSSRRGAAESQAHLPSYLANLDTSRHLARLD